MIASAVLDARSSSTIDNRKDFVAEWLVGVGRTREEDDPPCVAVRAHEMYVELLSSRVPAAARVFEQRRGAPLAETIWDLCCLAATCIGSVTASSGLRARLDWWRDDDPRVVRMRPIARRLSRSREEFRDAFAALRAANRGLAFQPLRETPLLRLDDEGDHRYVILHTDFLLAAADDGIYFSIENGLPEEEAATFRTKFGEVVEAYAESVLRRCTQLYADASFVRIDDDKIERDEGVSRCDFGMRFGDDLVLVESKRTNLNADMLMGGPGTKRRYEKTLVPAYKQLIATARDIRELGALVVAPGIATRADWQPRRIFALTVSHRPIFLWWGSGKRLLVDAGLTAEWRSVFNAWPHAACLRDLEVLESALRRFDIRHWLDAMARTAPEAECGLPHFLKSSGWNGPAGSDVIAAKSRALAVENQAAIAHALAMKKQSGVSTNRGGHGR